MGVIYELISKLEKLEYFKDLLKQGIISPNFSTCKEIYDYYLEERKRAKGKQLISNVAEKYNISDRSVYRIIQKMED